MRITLAALAAAILLSPLPARADFPRLGIFRKKKEDPPAAPKAKQSVEALLTSPDEKKRLAAVGELGKQDPRSNPDVIPALISALQQDPSPAVRGAAAETIGKLKPVAQPAGVALEQSVATDPAEEVRKAAQKGLWDYHLNGYKSAGAMPAYPQTAEPPLAKSRATGVTIPPPKTTAALPSPLAAPQPVTPQPTPPQPVTPRPITSGIGKGAIYPQTIEPPLAKPKPSAVAPPSPTLSVPPLPPPGTGVSIPPPPATSAVAPPPATAVPGIPIPMPPGPAAPTVPAGPTVPTIPPPF